MTGLAVTRHRPECPGGDPHHLLEDARPTAVADFLRTSPTLPPNPTSYPLPPPGAGRPVIPSLHHGLFTTVFSPQCPENTVRGRFGDGGHGPTKPRRCGWAMHRTCEPTKASASTLTHRRTCTFADPVLYTPVEDDPIPLRSGRLNDEDLFHRLEERGMCSSHGQGLQSHIVPFASTCPGLTRATAGTEPTMDPLAKFPLEITFEIDLVSPLVGSPLRRLETACLRGG